MRVRLTVEIREAIGRAGQAAYPMECCGVLVGRREDGLCVVCHCVAAENVAEAGERHHRYLLDPRAHLRAQRAAELEGMEVVGFYHSHPDHAARFSVYDIEHAWPGYVYVIVRVTQAGPHEMTAWGEDGQVEIEGGG